MEWLRIKLRALGNACANQLPLLFSLVFIFAVPVVVSLWFAEKHDANWKSCLEFTNCDFFRGYFFGIAFLAILICIAYKGWREYTVPITHAVCNKSFAILFGAGVLLVVLLFALLYDIEIEDGQDRPNFLMFCLRHDPGGIFAVVIGTATVIGLYYTWQSLREIKRIISSFSDLIDRLCEMAKFATPDSPLKILAYTPAIGFLSQPIDDWNRLRNALDQKDKGLPITEIICLREQDLDIWHKLFEGRITLRGKVDRAMTEEATSAANILLEHLCESSVSKIKGTGNVHRLPWRYMPGFYLFMVRERAIIVTPLFLPFPKGAPKDRQTILPSVQMIGVETQDRAIIRDIENIFQYYKNIPPSPLAEADHVVKCEELQKWLTNAANADLSMAQLRDQLLKSSGLTDATIKDHITKNPNDEITLSLDAYFKTW